jgi:hypothetical protein
VSAPVELLDVYPTILDLAGLDTPAGLDGESLVPLLQDPKASGRGGAVSYRRVQPPPLGWSLRTESERYTLWPDGSEELYEGCPCPPDSKNRAGEAEWASRKRSLRTRLEQRIARGAKAP